MDLADLDAPLIGAFLTYLEADRDNSVRTRNARLAAIDALFRLEQEADRGCKVRSSKSYSSSPDG